MANRSETIGMLGRPLPGAVQTAGLRPNPWTRAPAVCTGVCIDSVDPHSGFHTHGIVGVLSAYRFDREKDSEKTTTWRRQQKHRGQVRPSRSRCPSGRSSSFQAGFKAGPIRKQPASFDQRPARPVDRSDLLVQTSGAWLGERLRPGSKSRPNSAENMWRMEQGGRALPAGGRPEENGEQDTEQDTEEVRMQTRKQAKA